MSPMLFLVLNWVNCITLIRFNISILIKKKKLRGFQVKTINIPIELNEILKNNTVEAP